MATTASVSNIPADNAWDSGYGSQSDQNAQLLGSYLASGGDPYSIVLANIPYAQYDIYVYFNNDYAGHQGKVTVGSTTYDFSTEGGDQRRQSLSALPDL